MPDKLREEIRKELEFYFGIEHKGEYPAEFGRWNNNVSLSKAASAICEIVEPLHEEIARLKNGECEHVAQKVLSADCTLCGLAVADKGYQRWVKKAREYRRALEEMLKIIEDDSIGFEATIDNIGEIAQRALKEEE